MGEAALVGAGPAPPKAGTLFVVATPIGNLEDITLRALRVLREVDVVAAEDTRRTSHLLGHYGIRAKLVSVHEHNERRRIPQLLGHLTAGQSIALVTDAGTPGASDPGMLVVRAVRESNLRVQVVPGPSAVIAALSASGRAFDRFLFAGFPPIKSKDRKLWVRAVSTAHVAVVLYEAPHRVRQTLVQLQEYLVNRPITVCRELTKIHEEVFSGTVSEVLVRLTEPRGEFTLILDPLPEGDRHRPALESNRLDELVSAEIGQITESQSGLTRRQLLKEIAARLDVPVRDVYAAVERTKDRS